MQDQRITRAIFRAVEEINQQLPIDKQLEQSLDTVLWGKSAKLASIDLVNLIVTTEQNIEEEFGLTVTLADERAMSLEKSPFRTIGTLADYIGSLLPERVNG